MGDDERARNKPNRSIGASEPPRAKARGITLVQAALVQNLLFLGFLYSA